MKLPTFYDEHDEPITIPHVWEICDTCRGGGTGYLGNRGFVLTEEDRHDQDFMEDMMSGHYDQPCTHCGGSGKLQVPDWDNLSAEVLKEIDQYAAMQRADAQERAMGA